MKLILTEKPSVAADFARALHGNRKEGYYESSEYIITYCVGHLLELYDPDDYNQNDKTWRLEALPIIPGNFSYKPIPDTFKQLKVIKSLITGKQYSQIILATDAGREGELIGRLVLQYCNFTNYEQLKRFWSSEALTEEVILKNLNKLADSTNYDTLYKSGYYRQLADWLIGINYSRYLTLKFNDLFSFGRVQTAVLSLICQRQSEIDNFVSTPFFQLMGLFAKDGLSFSALYKDSENKAKFASVEALNQLKEELKQVKTATVKQVEKKEKQEPPPLLFNLTALQKEANKLFGYSADKTLNIAQKLYEEHKCLSYPRTPSKVLGDDNVNFVKGIIQKLSGKYPELTAKIEQNLVNIANKRVFNSALLEDHHALVPLAPLPEAASGEEVNIYKLVLNSFITAFMPALRYTFTSVIIDVNNLNFYTSGRTLIDPGWTVIKNEAKEEEEAANPEQSCENEKLPDLQQGMSLQINSFTIKEGKTQPPPYFTEATILAAMEHPNKFIASVDESEEQIKFEKDSGLGTQATRSVIIKTLFDRKYIEKKGKQLIPTPKGIYLISNASKLNYVRKFCDVGETARWEHYLNSKPEVFFTNIIRFINESFKSLQTVNLDTYKPEAIGKCPVCGADLIDGKYSYYCSKLPEKTCTFSFPKLVLNAKISLTLFKQLLKQNKTTKALTFTNKEGKEFQAKLGFENDYKLKFIFN